MALNLDGLDAEQREAVTLPLESNALVLAGAGSGKTRVLTHRIAYLLEKGVPAYNILAVTFTRKAADEMKQRLGNVSSSLWVNTFHGIASRLLRENLRAANFSRNFDIIATGKKEDWGEQEYFIKALIEKYFPSLIPESENRRSPFHPKEIAQWISNEKEAKRRSATWKKELETEQKRFQIYEEYQRENKPEKSDDEEKFMESFIKQRFPELAIEKENSDSLLNPKNIAKWILENKSENKERSLRKEIKEKEYWTKIYEIYEHECNTQCKVDFAEMLLRLYEVLRDNEVVRTKYQQRFRYILVDEVQDINALQYDLILLLAGDGARVLMVGDDDQSIYGFRGASSKFLRSFKEKFNPEIVELGRNYRSTANIVKVANTVIANNQDRTKEKDSWTENEAGDPVQIYSAKNEQEEAEYVLSQIRKLNKNGVPLSQMAVIYRKNALSCEFETTFAAAHIKYCVYGDKPFFAREEVQLVSAYMRLIKNPTNKVALRAIEEQRAVIDGENSEDQEKFDIWQFVESLQEFSKKHTLFELTKKIIKDAHLFEYYKKKNKSFEKRIESFDNLSKTLNAVQNFMDDETLDKGEDALSAFLAYAEQLSKEEQEEDAVQLMTVHKSKGLEFDAVFVVGLEEGTFPDFRSVDNPKELEEERRNCYVALTRAHEYLYLTHARIRTIFSVDSFNLWTKIAKRSRFLDEVESAPKGTWQKVGLEVTKNEIEKEMVAAAPKVEIKKETIAAVPKLEFKKETVAALPRVRVEKKEMSAALQNAFKKEAVPTAPKKASSSVSQTTTIGRDYYGKILHLNDLVNHKKYGRGKIVKFKLNPTILEIDFENGETHTIDLGNRNLWKV